MADKLRPGVVVVPEFVDGETVRAAKLNSIGSQLQRATAQLEKAVGDIHDESYPYSSLNSKRLSLEWGRSWNTDAALTSAATRSLDIASLARLIGPASNLNPYLPNATVEITEIVPVGVFEFYLRFPASVITSATEAAVVTLKGNASLLTLPGNYCIDAKGRVATYSVTTGGEVTYSITPSAWGSGPNYTGSTLNVIPDPNQLDAGGSGCTVSGGVDASGRHTITLPLCTHSIRNVSGTSVTLTAADPHYNEQILLPRILTDTYLSEEVIPSGFLHLKNWTTGQTYSDAVYYYTDSYHLLVGGVDLVDEVSAGNKFVIVTVGTDITSTLDDVRQKVATHTHDRSKGEAPIDAADIVGWVSEAGGSGRFTLSVMAGNFAPQYLHRDGYDPDEADLNDRNIMRGHLVLGRSGASPGGRYTDTGASNGLYFGTLNGPSVKKSAGTVLEISNPLGNTEILGANLYIEPTTVSEEQIKTVAPKLYTLYMSGLEFRTLHPATAALTYGDTEGYVWTGDTGQRALAPLSWRIPNGAILNTMYLVYDKGHADDAFTVSLYRVAIATGVGEVMNSIAAGAAVGAVTKITDSTFLFEEIDYTTYTYHLLINWTNGHTAGYVYSVGFRYYSDLMGN